MQKIHPKLVLSYSPRTQPLPGGTFLHFWYANNAGRGTSNCTIIRSTDAVRAVISSKQTGIIKSTTTSSWKGNVNFSGKIRAELEA